MILKNLSQKDKNEFSIPKFFVKYKLILIYILCISIISATFATSRIYTSDYIPINGDFQNYNAFRRILSGQIPYENFSNYLGVGILIINLPLLFFQNNFTTSLFITNFTACFVFCLSVTTLFYICTKNKYVACILGAIAPFLCTIISHNIQLKSILCFYGLDTPGNSMRTERTFLPFLLVLMFLVVKKVYFKIKNEEIKILELIKSSKSLGILGFIIGLFIVWSNDFGFACFISAFIIISVLLILANRKINYKYFCLLFIFGISAVGGFFISVIVITKGNIKAFIDFTLGVASYQFWYYGTTPDKLLTLKDVFDNKTYVIYLVAFAILTIIYIIKIFKKTIHNNDILIYFIELSAFLASAIYIYGSGGYLIEPLSLTTFIIYMGYVINLALSFVRRKVKFQSLDYGIIYCSLLIIISIIYSNVLVNKYSQLKDERNVPYVDELKGYTKFGESLKSAKNIIGDEEVFSTYASALEVMLNKYQPSGTDYIIHVLGDKQREDYMKNFNENKYKYVSTIRDDFTDYEAWVKRANWFFYRDLYRNYKPVSYTDYAVIWEKSNKINIDSQYQVSYNKINDYTYEITVISDNKNDIVADLSVNYKSSFINNKKRLITFKHIVCVNDENMADETINQWNNYFIPNESQDYKVPVFLYNGQGKLIITSKPNGCTKLEVMDVKVNELLPNYFHLIDKNIQASRINDSNWSFGISRYANVLLFKNTEYNRKALEDAKQLRSGDVSKNVKNIEYINNQWIHVTLQGNEDIEAFSYPNKIEVIK